MCGERPTIARQTVGEIGSSPRVRGTRHAVGVGGVPNRFIPACAGNANWNARSSCIPSVHPRVCGERLSGTEIADVRTGSSPRVRGTPQPPFLGEDQRRFIPACAGNANDATADEIRYDGSSPRVRGTPRSEPLTSHFRRFIPACAGNACASAACDSARRGSSPRVRGTLGELAFQALALRFIPACAGNAPDAGASLVAGHGSSPRVRGTRAARTRGRTHRRFIPACAGNATSPATTRRSATVHPRVCGERSRHEDDAVRDGGSSPRVRGTLAHGRHSGRGTRFIPACAGNARPAAAGSWSSAVHPRVCGERRPVRRLDDVGLGSSPRVRGTLPARLDDGESGRFIPACAGNAFMSCATPAHAPVHPRVCGERSPRMA